VTTTDAVVIGVYERACYGDQFDRVAVVLRQFGIEKWSLQRHPADS
jgi:hypothetical protein